MRASALALLLLAGCAREIPARPALYVLRGGGATIWLFGTVHALPANVRWETPAITRAIGEADALVGELPGGADAGAAFTRLSSAPGLPPLAARLPSEARAEMAAAAARCGGARLDRLKSWAAALVLSACTAKAAGGTPEAGVEAVLARRFAGRPQLGLESVASQFALFEGLAEADQRRLLAQSLSGARDYPRLLRAWYRGDEAALAALVDHSFAGAPRLRAALVDARNARWARWIAARRRQPGTIFIAVGAGHLAGRGALIERLRALGLRVERIA